MYVARIAGLFFRETSYICKNNLPTQKTTSRMNSLTRITAIFSALLCVLVGATAFAQNVGIANTTITPDAQAILELRSTDKGVLLPRMTTTQANTLATSLNAADDGMTIYDTTTKLYKYWDGSTLAWRILATNATVASSTLDDAYDAGGAGAGRAITGDAGAVVISGTGGADALTTDGDVRIGLTSGTNNDLYLSDDLIDWDNQSYFIDPGSDSRMNQIEFDNGSIGNPTVWFEGDNNSGLYQPADGQVAVTINGSEAMRINAGRDMGIGTTAPNARLEVQEAAGGSPFVTRITKESNTANELIGIGFGSQIGQHYAKSGVVHERESANGTGKLHFLVDNATDGADVALTESRMTIDRNGLVGIGTTAPILELDVRDGKMVIGDGGFAPNGFNDENQINIITGANAVGNQNGISFYENNTNGFGMSIGYDGSGSGATNAVRFYDNLENPVVTIENGGEVGIGTTTPAQDLHVVGTTRVSTLAGAGTRMVVADANGDMTTQTIPANGDITGVTAGDGLTGGGTTGAVTLNVVANNGLTANADNVQLGGTLIQATTVTAGTNNLDIDLNSTGDFRIMDGGTTRARFEDGGRVEFPSTNDASGAAGSGVLEIGDALRFDNNEIITNTNAQLLINHDNNGDVRIDNTTFMVDASTNRVGIGTTAPSETLHVVGDARVNGLAGTGERPVHVDANGVLQAGRAVGFPTSFSSAMRHSPDDVNGTTLSGDDVGTNYTMPFSINIGGTSYNQIRVCSNGWVAFGLTSGTDLSNGCLPTNNFNVPVVFAYWDDLVTEDQNIEIEVGGTAGGRVVTIKAEAYKFNNSGQDVNYEVMIHEGGLITVNYWGNMASQTIGQSATIGFQMAGGASAVAYSVSCNEEVIDDNDERQAWSIFIPQN